MDNVKKFGIAHVPQIVFDTVPCDLFFDYNIVDNIMGTAELVSNLAYVKQSSRKWYDDCSYGMCSYRVNKSDFKELVKVIKDKKIYFKEERNSREERELSDNEKEKLILNFYSGTSHKK